MGSFSSMKDALARLHFETLLEGFQSEMTLSSWATDTIYKDCMLLDSGSVSIVCICIISVAWPVNVCNKE